MTSPLPPGLPGVDPRWSTVVQAFDAGGVARRWHVLDNGVAPSAGTMVCVHGNPTWSFLWRRFLSEARPGWRVLAVDQLGMGYSQRPSGSIGSPRRLRARVADLHGVLTALNVVGPVVLVGHDWGGPIGLGWALQHHPDLVGLILANTAVHQPADRSAPLLLRLAGNRALLRTVCRTTPTFVAATAALSRPPLPVPVRRALAGPYRTAAQRDFVAQFVADIPFTPSHPSHATLQAIATGLEQLSSVPTLLLYGPRDPVFGEAHLADLYRRLPHADMHRYPMAGHLLPEDAPQTATDSWTWVSEVTSAGSAPAGSAPAGRLSVAGAPVPRSSAACPPVRPPWAALTERALGEPDDLAVAEVRSGRRVTFGQLDAQVADAAAGLTAAGVSPGDRVALLVPPGIDLTVAVYACWRAGAVIVVADAGLGLRAMGRALRGAAPDHVIGVPRGLAAAQALRIPGQRVLVGNLTAATRRLLRARQSLATLIARGSRLRPGGLASPTSLVVPDAEAAVLFTSGATGPAKGVVYRLGQLRAQLDLIGGHYALTGEDRIVAAFAPFALYGPGLGIGAAVPDMDVTAPGSLSASALADAIRAVSATVVFASPATLRQVHRTSTALDEDGRAALRRIRLVLTAGAPVPLDLLERVAEVMPAAALHTPYGMTEALPVCDIDLAGVRAAGTGDGVCVGRPLPGVSVRVSPLSGSTTETPGELTDAASVTGELCVSAAHVKERYDRLWATERASTRFPGWHRTGDVGHLDQDGRVWVEGRTAHVLDTAGGPLTPVGVEQRVMKLPSVSDAALVGVGPTGTQHPVVVVVPKGSASGGPMAGPALSAQVRQAAAELSPTPVAAVLVRDRLPVDIRHQSKVDRVAVAQWAAQVLAGQR